MRKNVQPSEGNDIWNEKSRSQEKGVVKGDILKILRASTTPPPESAQKLASLLSEKESRIKSIENPRNTAEGERLQVAQKAVNARLKLVRQVA